MIEVLDLSKKIKNHIIFSQLNFTFNQNGIYLIEGENGIGKSTFLKIIGSIVQTSQGEINWSLPHSKDKTGFIFDFPLYIDQLSFSDNLRFLGSLLDLDNKYVENKINYFSELFHLPLGTKKTVNQYSSGMKRKVEIAISLINNPNCLIWDEPFDSLDKESIEIIFDEIITDDKMFIITTHNKEIFLKETDVILRSLRFDVNSIITKLE